MILKYKDFEVKAETQEEAIDKIVQLAIEKDRGEDKLEERAIKLFISWCLCDYLTKYGKTNDILILNKISNLITCFKSCCLVDFRNMDSRKIKKDFLEKIWIEEEECLENPSNMVSTFIETFDDEGIEYDDEKYTEIAKDFVKDISEIISMISEHDIEKFIAYVKSKFKNEVKK